MKICYKCLFSILESIVNLITLGIKNHEKHV
nr:MAG TPA: hypothetical protein [Microviridae sp.]